MSKTGISPISGLDPISVQVGEKSLIDFSTGRSILIFPCICIYNSTCLMVNFPPPGTGTMSLSVLPQHLGN